MTRLFPSACVVLLLGCSGSEGSSSPAVPDVDPTFELTVRATEESNRGRSVRMLTRWVTQAEFATDDYEAMVRLVEVPDDSVVGDRLLRPDSTIRIQIPVEKDGPIGVYFFFREPDADGWKVLVDPTKKSRTIELGPDSVVESPGEVASKTP